MYIHVDVYIYVYMCTYIYMYARLYRESPGAASGFEDRMPANPGNAPPAPATDHSY